MAAVELVDDGFFRASDLAAELGGMDTSRMSYEHIVDAAVGVIEDVRFLKEKAVYGNSANFAAAVTVVTGLRECGVPAVAEAFRTYAEERLEASRRADLARIEAEDALIDREFQDRPDLAAWLKS
jgi:hypothetical protein